MCVPIAMPALWFSMSQVPSAVQEILSAEPVIEPKDIEEEEDASKDASLQEQNVMLDWKGDPMIVNPGDRLPFNLK